MISNNVTKYGNQYNESGANSFFLVSRLILHPAPMPSSDVRCLYVCVRARVGVFVFVCVCDAHMVRV